MAELSTAERNVRFVNDNRRVAGTFQIGIVVCPKDEGYIDCRLLAESFEGEAAETKCLKLAEMIWEIIISVGNPDSVNHVYVVTEAGTSYLFHPVH